MKGSLAWECACGHIEYGEMPEECPKCFKIGSFTNLPEELMDEREKDHLIDLEEETLAEIKSSKSLKSIASAKSKKPKLKKPGRKKK